MGEVTYREFDGLGRFALGLVGVGVVALVLASLVDGPTRGWLILLAVLVSYPAFFLGGTYWKNRIKLTPEYLVVGSERYVPSDFDLAFGVQPPLVLAPDEQAAIESPYVRSADRGFRVAGGSWGRPVGTAIVVLQDRDRQGLVAVCTRRPEVLDPLLTEWLERVPEPGSEPDPG